VVAREAGGEAVMERIVTVNVEVQASPAIPPREYVILVNPTPRRASYAARKHKAAYVFSFLDKPIGGLPDWSRMKRSPYAHRIAAPLWIGNFPAADRENVLRQTIEHYQSIFGDGICVERAGEWTS
jgi:hypothetical protein